jgi:hypothetical protein
MKTIIIDLSTILYWFILIYLPFNIIISFFDYHDDKYSFNLKEKPFSILNPFRNVKVFKEFWAIYLLFFLLSIMIGIGIHFLIEYLQKVNIIFIL